jgi:hypothetical protein
MHEELFASLRAKGYEIGDVYVQSGVGQTGAMMHVVINGVAMPFPDATALEQGIVTLEVISQRRSTSTPTN